MSLLIKGMEMPTSCSNCELCACYKESKGEVYRCDITMYPVKYFEVRLDNCPLVPVPPHGRLIDADEADSRFTPDFTELSDFQCGWNAAMKRVCEAAPTIIEAEEASDETVSE